MSEPACSSTGPGQSAAPPPTPPPEGGPRILLIEDNAADIELIRTAFDEIGVAARFTVHRDGDAAIAGLRQAAASEDPFPDLVLLDLNLPRASGHEVLTIMRAIRRFDAVPVVVLSTSNHQTDRSRCLHAGANGYLVKPALFEDLLTLVGDLRRQWLERT